jgi:WD40 repeat protein
MGGWDDKVIGERMVTTSEDRIVTIWNAHTGKQIYALNPHASRINCLAVDPKNALIAISGGNGTVSFWDTRTGQLAAVSGAIGGYRPALLPN